MLPAQDHGRNERVLTRSGPRSKPGLWPAQTRELESPASSTALRHLLIRRLDPRGRRGWLPVMPPRYLHQGLRALARADQPLRGGACPFTKSPRPCFPSMCRSSSDAAATRAAAGVSRCHPCTRLDDSMCQLARAHSLKTWAARCATLGAHRRERGRRPFLANVSMRRPADPVSTDTRKNGSGRCMINLMPTDCVASRRPAEPLRRPHSHSG
jgi:hypothetical protein